MILTPSTKNLFRCEFIIASLARSLNCSLVSSSLSVAGSMSPFSTEVFEKVDSRL